MNVTLEEVSACRKRLKIEVPANKVSDAIDRVTNEFQKAAKIPGFRPGKAPVAMVKKKFQKDIESETQRTLVPEAFREAVKSKNLQVLNAPHIEDLHFQPGLSLSFSTLIDLPPEFTLPNYTGIPVKKEETAVTDEEVTKTLDTLREQRADFVNVEPPRPLAMEDFGVIAYEGKIEGKPIKEIAPEMRTLGENPNFWLWMKEDAFLPKFPEQCVGMNIGDQRDVEVEIPADFPPSVAGKKAVFHVTLKEVKSKKLPEVNEEFAQEIAKLSLEELKKRVHDNLESQKKAEIHRNQSRQVVDHLLAAVNFELPESVVAEETRQAVYEIVAENQARGISNEMLEEKKQEIFTNAGESAKQAVKLKLIAGKIAEKEKITINDEDMAMRLQELAMQRQVPLDEFVQMAIKNNAIEPIREKILLQKVIDFILQAAKVE